jgi:hypothetical protein
LIEKKKQIKENVNAILAGWLPQGKTEALITEYLDELSFLAETAGANEVKRFYQKLEHPDSKTFLGKGKLEEIKKYIAGRLGDFDLLSSKLKELIVLLQDAKKETINSYRENPEFRAVYGTDLAVSLLDDIIKLFK